MERRQSVEGGRHKDKIRWQNAVQSSKLSISPHTEATQQLVLCSRRLCVLVGVGGVGSDDGVCLLARWKAIHAGSGG